MYRVCIEPCTDWCRDSYGCSVGYRSSGTQTLERRLRDRRTEPLKAGKRLRRTHRPLQTRVHLCSSDLVPTDAVVQITMTQRSLRSEAPSHHKLHRLLRCLVRISFSSMDDSSPRSHHRPLKTAETTTGSDSFPTIIQLFRSHLLNHECVGATEN